MHEIIISESTMNDTPHEVPLLRHILNFEPSFLESKKTNFRAEAQSAKKKKDLRLSLRALRLSVALFLAIARDRS
jgi:Holliday junction resolvase RusA-like endonuclease